MWAACCAQALNTHAHIERQYVAMTGTRKLEEKSNSFVEENGALGCEGVRYLPST